ncbi:TPA: phage tail protein [Clostridioides difficile]|nr:phage tail protein [Clostridioides difficile]MDE3612447.1 phage tail protein [Clostridioides difficile]MDM9793660.1 phage tail protein [Clostridioides difficile]HBF8686637.1 phage tail protein [Clostridioides difficile]
MSWAETYKVNSDLQGEPLNFLSYLQDIKLNGLDSYVLFIGNARIWEELYLNSLYLFSNKGIRDTVYTAFSETDIDNLFNKSTKLGEQLNAFYRTNVYSLGNADSVVKEMTIEHYNSLEQKFKDGYDRYVTREQEKATIGVWFNSTFNLNNTDLESLATIDDILANTEATNAILNNSNAIVALTMCESSMDAVVASSNAMDLLGQYILKVTTEPAVIRAILENNVIREAIINSTEAMTQIAINADSIIEILKNLEAVKLLQGNSQTLEIILTNEDIAKEIFPNIISLKTLISTINSCTIAIGNNIESAKNTINSITYKNQTFPFLSEIKENYEEMENIKNLTVENVPYTLDIINNIINNLSIMRVITQNTLCINSIISNSHAMNAVANSANAVMAFCENLAGLKAIFNNTTARNAILNSSTAMPVIVNDARAISMLANNNTYFNAISNNSTAMTYVVNSSTAMSYVADSSTAMSCIVNTPSAINKVINSSVAMGKVATTGRALREMCKVESVSVAIAEKMQTYHRTSVVSALNNSSLFSKTTVDVGNGSGTVNDGLNTNTIYIPMSCYDDGDTSFTAYYGCKDSLVVVPEIAKHKGNVTITSGVSFRGVKVAGSGSSVGYITFDKYTAL